MNSPADSQGPQTNPEEPTRWDKVVSLYERLYPLITFRFLGSFVLVLIWLLVIFFSCVRIFREPGSIWLAGSILDPSYNVPETRKPSELSFLLNDETVKQFRNDLLDPNKQSFQYIFTNLPPPVRANLLLSSNNIVTFKTNFVSGLEQVLTLLNATNVYGIRLRDKTITLANKERTPSESVWLGILTIEDIYRSAHPPRFLDFWQEEPAPFTILVLFLVILVLMAYRICIIIRDTLNVVSFENEATDWNRLKSVQEKCKLGCVNRRVQFLNRPKRAENLETTLPAVSALDDASVGEGYTAIKICIWILPVIGFVGTAMGMSVAIDGFKQALQGGTDVDRLTSTLGSVVIPGLASAFYTTIMALLAAVFGHFCATILEESEHTILGRLDRASLSFIQGHARISETGKQFEQPIDQQHVTPQDLANLEERLQKHVKGEIETIRNKNPPIADVKGET